MILWRITNHLTLDGGGGLRASSRWHTRGRRVIYCAPNPATALLEILVHAEIDIGDIPLSYRYLEIEVPDELGFETADPAPILDDWRAALLATRRIGDEWLQAGRSPLLRVPCVIVPSTFNVLVNPEHPASSSIRIVRAHEHALDPRLIGM